MTSRETSKPIKRPPLWLRFGWLLPLVAAFIGVGILSITYAFAAIPLPENVELASSAEVYDRNGRLIGTYSDEVRRFLVDIDELPDYIGEAVIASEDREFFEHNGVSVRAIARAAWANFSGGEIQQGGSTITQQYVKIAVLKNDERTLTRKAQEAILAVKLERQHSKRQILGFYLNTIYLGRSAYGIEAAARSYFDKHATDLSLSEAAYLAGIIPSPESYQLDEVPRDAKGRRNRTLRLMRKQGYIDRSELRAAKREKLELASGALGRVERQKAAYFMEWLRKDYLYPQFGERLYTGGLKIHTTLDLDMQRYAEEAVSSTLTERSDPEAALVSMTPSGAVRAMVGGKRYMNVRAARGFNYATSYPGRQAGSSFKPFTLLSAIESGISPGSFFPGGSPVTITDPTCAGEDGLWTPENFGGAQYGLISLDEATTNSVNTVYAQLIDELGPGPVADLLADMSFDRHGTDDSRVIAPNCSLALGTLDVTPLEMARGFASFASRGTLPEVSPIVRVTDAGGDCVKSFVRDQLERCEAVTVPEPRRVAEASSVDILNETLTHVVEGGTATAAAIGRPVAGKTGTTQENVDAWFAGYVPQLTTVVWMGYPAERVPDRGLVTPKMTYCSDPVVCRPVHGIEVTGGSFPAAIWAAFMEQATADLQVESFPFAVDYGEVLNKPAPTPTPSETETPTPTPSETETPTPTPSETETPTPTPSETPTPTPSETPTPTPSETPTPTPSESETPSPTPSPTATKGGGGRPTPRPSPSPSPSSSGVTSTPTPTPSSSAPP